MFIFALIYYRDLILPLQIAILLIYNSTMFKKRNTEKKAVNVAEDLESIKVETEKK